ncbi:hypothetical protein ACFVWX_19480 [Streptomyces sp. NPDC058220]|uniref:hypothetical protein n=1 Tax=unclassified Streptomyces TaxID=2593676 RepID=UPI0036500D97
MAVYDRGYEMPAEIYGFVGPLVLLIRPTGLNWKAHRTAVRPATAHERVQLRALAALHRQRLRGM